MDNLQLVCGSCNRIKGQRGAADLQTKLQLRQSLRLSHRPAEGSMP